MQISETKDNYWIIENDTGHIDFDLNINRAYFYKKRSGIFKDQIDQTPVREWSFNGQNLSGLDVFLVLMKSLHL
jgi:hypothetical protein